MYSMLKAFARLLAVVFLSLKFSSTDAQSATAPSKDSKPYKIITAGKQITIRSSKEIKQVMLWTNGGNRLVEQKDIGNSSFTFTIPVNGRYFYLMVGLANGKIYTEKIGIQ